MGPRAPLNLLAAANAVSLSGNVMATVAIPWLVLTTTGSAALTGVAAFAATGPMVVGSLLAGRIVDRLGAARTSITTDLVSGVTVALIPVLHFAGLLELWHLVALVAVGTVLDSAGSAARVSLVPALASDAGIALEAANARFGGAEHAGYLLGAPLAGVLIAVIGPANVLWVDAATFGVSAVLLALGAGRRPPLREAAAVPGSLREAARAIRDDPVLLTLLVVPAAGALLIDPLVPVVLPIYVRATADSPVWLGVAVAAYGVGGLVGLFASSRLRARLRRRTIYVGAFGVWAALYVVLVAVPPIMVAVLVVGGVGLCAGLIAPIETSVVQERAPPTLLPRVIGVTTAAFRVTGPLAIVAVGISLERLGLTPTLAVLTAGTVALAGLVAVGGGVRRFDDAPPHLVAEERNGRGERQAAGGA